MIRLWVAIAGFAFTVQLVMLFWRQQRAELFLGFYIERAKHPRSFSALFALWCAVPAMFLLGIPWLLFSAVTGSGVYAKEPFWSFSPGSWPFAFAAAVFSVLAVLAPRRWRSGG